VPRPSILALSLRERGPELSDCEVWLTRLAAAHAAADYAAEPAFAADDGATTVGAAGTVGALDEASSLHVDLPY